MFFLFFDNIDVRHFINKAKKMKDKQESKTIDASLNPNDLKKESNPKLKIFGYSLVFFLSLIAFSQAFIPNLFLVVLFLLSVLPFVFHIIYADSKDTLINHFKIFTIFSFIFYGFILLDYVLLTFDILDSQIFNEFIAIDSFYRNMAAVLTGFCVMVLFQSSHHKYLTNKPALIIFLIAIVLSKINEVNGIAFQDSFFCLFLPLSYAPTILYSVFGIEFKILRKNEYYDYTDRNTK